MKIPRQARKMARFASFDALALVARVALVAAVALLAPIACSPSRSAPTQITFGLPGSPDRLAIAARVEPVAPRMGSNTLWLELRDASGQTIDDAHVEARIHMPAMGAMAAMGGPATVRAEGSGAYRADFELAMGGTWQVEIAVHRPGSPDAAMARGEGSLTVGTAGLRLAALPAAGRAAGAARADDASPAPRQTHDAAATEHAAPVELALDPARLQRIGVTTVAATRRALPAELRVVGRIVLPEDAIHDVSLKLRGWATTVRAAAVGVAVREGDTLFELESAELAAAQAEFVEALRSQARARATSAPDRADALVDAARARLRYFGLAPRELAALERGGEPFVRVPIRAPRAGFVVEKNLVAGGAIEPGERLYRIASLARVWVEAEIPESELARVPVGAPARIQPTHAADRAYPARIDALLPVLDPESRTLRARLVVENSDFALRPNMLAEVVLEGGTQPSIVVPQSALLDAGERDFVFVALGEGRFQPRAVEVGRRVGEEVEIRAGLAEGEEIVRSGTFLIAAESRLRRALEDW